MCPLCVGIVFYSILFPTSGLGGKLEISEECAISRGGLRSIARYVYDVQYRKVRSLQLAFRKPFKVMVEYTTVCTEY